MKCQGEKAVVAEQKLWLDTGVAEQLQKDMLYMDNAATTYHKPECVYQAMEWANRCLSVNAGRGSYQLAQMAVEGIDNLRKELLSLIQSGSQAEVVFAPSATFAMNQIAGGLMLCEQDRVYVSPFEHNAVMRTLSYQQKKCGFTILELPLTVDKLEIDLEKTEYLFHKNPPTHVFLSQISNVTGYILPVEEIFYMAKEITSQQAVVIVDAAQSFGLVPWNYQKLPVDIMVFAGHKSLYGPFGIAGFIKKVGLKLQSALAGGTGSDSLSVTMPEGVAGLEPGSPNITAVAGLYAAVQFLKKQGITEIYNREKQLTRELVKGLSNIEGVTLYLPENLERHIGIVSFSVAGYQSGEIGMILDEDYHIAVRTGYHCAPLIHKYLKDQEYGGTVRAALSCFTTAQEIERFVAAVAECVEGLYEF